MAKASSGSFLMELRVNYTSVERDSLFSY